MQKNKQLLDAEILIRKAKLSEAEEIFALLKPQIDNGFILNLDVGEVKRSIESYYVLLVDNDLATCAKFQPYGVIVEIAKVCTSSQFQGEGLAKVLIQRMKELAPGLGFSELFGLSVNRNMWRVFLSIGFKEVSRESLPNDWKIKYDFSRPSKAFRIKLKS